MALLTFLTDFGLTDYYVAAVKGTVLRLAPGTQIVDISHDVPPGDIATGAFLLGAAVPSFPIGTVHLAVVDPGVGSRRRLLAARTPFGGWVGPDNGLFTPLLADARVHSVERAGLFLPGPGQTFHGRDRFAPIAAWLLRGEPIEELGPEVADPVRLTGDPPRRSSGELRGRVIHVDRYGNLVTDIPAGWLPAEASGLRAEAGGHTATRFVAHYQQIPSGEAALLSGSLGTLELSLNGADLSRAWGVARGQEVSVTWREDRK
ncbi:MAG TPA: SAM-dependent chlorinase/fluorinase [Thermoanaerobaculia bacterium]|nr:SAM-dependent chlorinase/fluorinase [Thermoanaerobaculia bacterium]